MFYEERNAFDMLAKPQIHTMHLGDRVNITVFVYRTIPQGTFN